MSGDSEKGRLSPAQAALVERATGMAARLARWASMRSAGLLSAAELTSTGHEALVRAALTFDPARGIQFEQFAYRYVDGGIRNALKVARREQWRCRVDGGYDVAEQLADESDPFKDTDDDALRRCRAMADAFTAGMALGTVSSAGGAEGALSDAERERALAGLDGALGALPDREQQLVRLHHLEGKPLTEVAQSLGVSYATARRWNVRCLERLAEQLRSAA